ncbi:MAG: chemotaxis protein CheA [Deltaproteobacteria bacterium]|nr:chemotaxis protein CheA [Deltaproteobacteria bacterium]
MNDHDSLTVLINNLASDFLFIDGKEIDVPTAGKFLNTLDGLVKEADGRKMVQLKQVAGCLSSLLEKIVLNSVEDKKAGFNALEKGITLMQEIGESIKNTGSYEGSIEPFTQVINVLTGEQIVADVAEASPKESQPSQAVQIGDESLIRDFIVEGLEYIDEIEVNILNLEQDTENKEYINIIFRPFHSMKGVASFLNLEQIRELAHSLETILDKARNGELQVTPGFIDVILDGADALKAMIIQLRDSLEGKPVQPLEVDLPALRERIEGIEEERDDARERKRVGEILVEEGSVTEETLEEGLKIAGETVPPRKIGETLIAEGKVTPRQVSQALRKQAGQTMDTGAIRVDVRKLDDLIDMVGELVIAQSIIRQNQIVQSNGDSKLAKSIVQLSSITSEIQKTSTSLRMIPIKQTFQRMARLVRDLSKNTGKSIGVVMEGEETEIDRNMVDEIYNPLVHMIRNAVDHGIGSPEERVKQGKPERGTIQLRAYHRGGNIVIEISDDGKGLDKNSILKKAIEHGVVDGSHTPSDQDIYRLIFHPGLSTAKKVTDVSGRGVGMDVVKQSVEKLRGKIEIDSVPGEGSTFITRFPLTMAIINGMIVRVGGEKYIIPTVAIRQLLRPEQKSCNTVAGKGETINVMGHLMPLVRLYDVLHIKPEHEHPWEAVAVVIEGENGAKCILVDEIIGEEEVVIKSLGEGLKGVRGVSGGAIMGDGSVGLILDPEGVFELSEM